MSILIKYRWWYKGRTPDGNTMSLQGSGWALCFASASRYIEAAMRAKWPDVAWMQGKEVESGNLRFGPTIQMLKQTKEVA